MPRINIPYSQSSKTARPTTQSDNSQQLRAGTQGLSDMLNYSMNQAENLKSQAQRANLIAQETEFTNGLAKSLPAAMQELSGVMSNTVNALSAVDEKEYESEIKMLNNVYLLDKTGELQKEYQSVVGKIGDDPAKMMEWVNGKIMSHLNVAPSEYSKLQYLENAYRFKTTALNEAFGLARQKRTQQMGSTIDKYVGGLSEQAKANPDMADAYISQLADVGKILSTGGMPSDKIGQLLNVPKSQIRDAQLKGYIQSGRPSDALAALGNEKIAKETTLETKQYVAENAARDMLSLALQKKKELRTAIGMSAFESGTLSGEATGSNEVSYLHFTNFVNKSFGDTNRIDQSSMPVASSAISSYFKKYNKFAGSDTRNFIMSRLKTSENPYEASAYAMAIDDVISDDRFSGLNIASDLSSGNAEGISQAIEISTLVRAGEDPAKVVDKIRNTYASRNPALTQARAKEFGDYIKNNKPIDAVDSLYNGWFSKSPDNLGLMASEYERTMKSFYDYSGNMDVAAKSTKAYMSKYYQPSSINKTNEVMYAAPEIYFKGKMGDFNKHYENTLSKMFADKGGTFDPNTRTGMVDGKQTQVELRAIRGMTETQVGKKTYLLFDKGTGRVMTDPNGNYLSFTYGLDENKLKENMDKQVSGYTEQRDALNASHILKSDEELKNDLLNKISPALDKVFTNDQKNGIISKILGE